MRFLYFLFIYLYWWSLNKYLPRFICCVKFQHLQSCNHCWVRISKCRCFIWLEKISEKERERPGIWRRTLDSTLLFFWEKRREKHRVDLVLRSYAALFLDREDFEQQDANSHPFARLKIGCMKQLSFLFENVFQMPYLYHCRAFCSEEILSFDWKNLCV